MDENEHVKYLRDLGHLYGATMDAERCHQICKAADFIESSLSKLHDSQFAESGANELVAVLEAKLKESESRLASGLERIERLRGWIEERIDDCPYGEMDFEACGHNRKHGICESHAAAKVLAQDTFVSDPVVETQRKNSDGSV